MDFLKPPDWLVNLLPQQAGDFLVNGGWWLVLLVGASLLLVVVLLVLRRLARLLGVGKKPNAEQTLQENLMEYPPPPGKAGPRGLVVQGVPARVRLVVIAPVGKEAQIDASKAEPLLDHVIRGLGDLARQDRPRVRIWPPQLSNEGFAHTFHRLTRTPEPVGQPSRWVLLAGQARVGPHFILLGMAVLTDEKTSLGRMTLNPDRWPEVLRIR